MPSSGYDRHFYFDFTSMSKGNTYTCAFEGADYLIDYADSLFPAGVEYACTSESCEVIPFTLQVDATQMVDPMATMIIRYFVPASDITFPTTVSCKANN